VDCVAGCVVGIDFLSVAFMQTHYDIDILIIGSGLVGNSLALAIAKHANVAIIEKNSLEKIQSFQDDRPLTLSFSSYQILSTLSIWQEIQSQTIPIQQVHVSEAGHFGAVRFSAKDYDVHALGYVIPAYLLTQALHHNVLENRDIQKFYSTTVEKITAFPEGYRVEIKLPHGEMKTLTTKLLVGADGAHSVTRTLLGIAEKTDISTQIALTARIALTRSHHNIAYQRFTDQGVLATLPIGENEIGMVWSAPNHLADKLKKLSDADFCTQFQHVFGYRLGKFSNVEKRQAYPLHSAHALEQIRPHAVLLGNAAHTLYPIAAQGFNLSLRDTAVLAQIIMDAMSAGKNPGDFVELEKYLHARKKAQLMIQSFTQTVAKGQTAGFLGLEILPFTKDILADYAMGTADNLKFLSGRH